MMTSREVLDRALAAFDRQFRDRAETLRSRIHALGSQYRASTDVAAAMEIESEQLELERELRAVLAVRDNARGALQAAQHDAGRRTERIAWYRQAVAGVEREVETALRAEVRQRAERDLAAWRPELAKLEAEDAEVIRRFSDEVELAA